MGFLGASPITASLSQPVSLGGRPWLGRFAAVPYFGSSGRVRSPPRHPPPCCKEYTLHAGMTQPPWLIKAQDVTPPLIYEESSGGSRTVGCSGGCLMPPSLS
ncbi:hypothetical protein ATANTOWER_004283 [Ataeniobius toweri]|uniref:Uncharacterized protein n=1 Tax=Ataeniobius toweri TaxID=208326 RepID=A0ABU7BQP1_9TELE|nr:hypothetical protein [Ataeniobius toweri]